MREGALPDKTKQTANQGFLQWCLPADGGVDLQPPDEAFPPFLRNGITQKLHYAWKPSGGNLGKMIHLTEQHILKKISKQAGSWYRDRDCVTSDLAAAFCSCFILMASSLTGLGMNVMSAPSFTSRPIHQSLLYFCRKVKHYFCGSAELIKLFLPKASHLFYMQKVFGFKVDSCSLDWTIFI